MDVLEFTGIDKRYYNNERIQKFMRWQFGSVLILPKNLPYLGYVTHRENRQFNVISKGSKL